MSSRMVGSGGNFRSRRGRFLSVGAVALAGIALLLVIPSTLAQSVDPLRDVEVLRWFTQSRVDWVAGASLAVAGLIGALVTIFFLVGGVFPGISGQARILKDQVRLDRMTRRLERLVHEPRPNPKAIEAVETTVNNLRDDLGRDKARMFLVAGGLYAVLGAAFAAMLAGDVLQGVFIGAGWTSFLGTVGLKKEYQERKAEINENVAEIVQRLRPGVSGRFRRAKGRVREALSGIGTGTGAGAPMSAPAAGPASKESELSALDGDDSNDPFAQVEQRIQYIRRL